MMRIEWMVALLAAALAACGGGDEEPRTGDAPAETTAGAGTAGMPGMDGMQGMEGMQGMSAGMMAQMRAHMQQMQGATGAQMQADLPRHRQMVANMIAQMNREMSDMNMDPDTEWIATVEALREDLRRMPDMSAAELEAFLPGHRERVTRILDMHRDMMSGMEM